MSILKNESILRTLLKNSALFASGVALPEVIYGLHRLSRDPTLLLSSDEMGEFIARLFLEAIIGGSIGLAVGCYSVIVDKIIDAALDCIDETKKSMIDTVSDCIKGTKQWIDEIKGIETQQKLELLAEKEKSIAEGEGYSLEREESTEELRCEGNRLLTYR